MLAIGHTPRPAVPHVGPQDTGQQKTRRHGLALTDPPVGVLQSGLDKRLLRTFHHYIEQRVNATGQAQRVELRDRGQRVPGLQ